MFRDLKEYQEIAKIYADKVSKPENLEERRGSSPEQLAQNRKDAFKPATPPQKGAGGGVGNPTNVRGTGAGTVKPIVRGAQGRTKRPAPEVKKFPSTAEIRAKNPNAVGGGNAGASTDSGGTSQSTIKSVEQKPDSTPTPTPQTKPKMGSPDSKFIKRERGKVGFVKRGTPGAQRAENQEKAKLRAKAMAKARLAKKAEMAKEDYTPYDLVLDYLLSSEQVATIEEANYVMTEMDVETIQAIVEEQKKNIDEGIGKALMIGGALATPFLMKKFMKPKTDKMIDKQRNTSPIGGENRKKKIEKAAGAEGFFN